MNHPMNDEQLEYMLRRLGEASGPDVAFIKRMDQRLRRHYVMLSEIDAVATPGTTTAASAMRGGFWHFIRGRVYTTITALFFVVATGAVSTFAYTSDSVTNGTALYPIKRGIERVQQVFVSNPEQQATYHLQMLQRRLAESRVLTLDGVVDDATNMEVALTMDHGIAAIRVLPSIDRRDVLLRRVSDLIDEQEREVFARVGATVPVSAPVIAPASVVAPVSSMPASTSTSTPTSTSTSASVSVPPIVVSTPAVTLPRATPAVPSLSVPSVVPAPPVSSARVQTISPEPRPLSHERDSERRAKDEKSIQSPTAPQIPANISAPVRRAVERQHEQLKNAKIRLLRIEEQNGTRERERDF